MKLLNGVMKKKVLLAFTINLILLASVLNVKSSIQPIIVTDMPNPLHIGILQNVNLTWVVIDDNPRNFELYINDTLSRNESIVSDVITEPFSSPAGLYNLSLIVNDYSNYMVSTFQLINVSGYASTSSSTPSITSESYASTVSSPGFLFSILIAIFSISVFFKKLKKQRINK